MASKLHQELYLHQLGGLVRIQGCEDGRASGPALAVDLKTGSVGTVDGSRPLVQDSDVKKIFGIIGLQKLAAVYALAVVTSVRQVRIAADAFHLYSLPPSSSSLCPRLLVSCLP